MAGQMAGPIKTNLGIGTHVDPGSVLVKVKVIYLNACSIIEFMTEIVTENSWQRHLANNDEPAVAAAASQ